MFADEVRQGLSSSPKQLNPAYFYDALGSSLFDAICCLPWYKITQTERRMLGEHAAQIVADLPDPACLIELGCGNGEKLAQLVAALDHSERSAEIHLVDISASALAQTTRLLRRWPLVSVTAHQCFFETGLEQAIAQCGQHGPLLVLFLGSNIGNFDPSAAGRFLAGVRRSLRVADKLLLGVDLVKGEGDLRLAYDDPLGVTAAFNKNILLRINRELGGNFNLAAFDHHVIWNATAARVEMHLLARERQHVLIPGAACEASFEASEGIWTESSYKYRPEQLVALAHSSGFKCESQFLDGNEGFSLNCLVA